MFELNKIYTNIEVKDLKIYKCKNDFCASFSFVSDSREFSLNLDGIRDIENLTELFDAERIWINEDESSQVEFGCFTLGMSGECYSEVIFDSIL